MEPWHPDYISPNEGSMDPEPMPDMPDVNHNFMHGGLVNEDSKLWRDFNNNQEGHIYNVPSQNEFY